MGSREAVSFERRSWPERLSGITTEPSRETFHRFYHLLLCPYSVLRLAMIHFINSIKSLGCARYSLLPLFLHASARRGTARRFLFPWSSFLRRPFPFLLIPVKARYGEIRRCPPSIISSSVFDTICFDSMYFLIGIVNCTDVPSKHQAVTEITCNIY